MNLQLFRLPGIVTSLTLSTIALTIQDATAGDRRNFLIYNFNQQAIVRFYIAPTNSNSWGRDTLYGILASNSSGRVDFYDNSNRCVYDVMAVYLDGSYDTGRYNFCQISYIYFYGYGGDYFPR
ncbi:MAG: hypothetical protein KME17_11555 [Cyanosarcina radialis HA8281-LM2]|jgi:hypothetical protein|nr:hypothetical protein [Cyanosarcina radialis HA8281-LM2]